MKIFPLLFIALFNPLFLFGQYVTEDGDLQKDLILEEFQSFENASGEQNRKRKKILHELIKARKNHPVLLEVKEKRDKVSLAIIQIANKSGDFTFMQDDSYYNRDVDTINVEVIAIEQDLKSFRDSLQNRYNRLKVIIEDSTNSRSTRHKAAQLLGTSNELEDIKFIFDKHTELTFGLIEPDVPATETWGAERSAMANLSWHHIPHHPAEKLEKNWIVFPFLIEYWGGFPMV